MVGAGTGTLSSVPTASSRPRRGRNRHSHRSIVLPPPNRTILSQTIDGIHSSEVVRVVRVEL
jgi:hypothetical protein